MKYILLALSCLSLSGCTMYAGTTFRVLNRDTRVVEYEQNTKHEYYLIDVDKEGRTTFFWKGNRRYVTNPKTQIVEINP